MPPRRASLVLACLLSAFPSAAFSADEPARTDAHGDPLPPGALLRLGTVRWRACAHFLAFKPDGKTLVSAAREGPVEFWDVPAGAPKGVRQDTRPIYVPRPQPITLPPPSP